MKYLIIISLCLCIFQLPAQNTVYQARTGKKPVAFCKTPPLKDIEPYREKVIHVPQKEEAHSIDQAAGLNLGKNIYSDPVVQDEMGLTTAPPLIQNFDGLGPFDITCTNPDTDGDVGLNHYMQMIKRSFAIWDKEGNLLYGPVHNKTLWSTLPGPWLDHVFTDPIVVYDHFADRWLASNMVYSKDWEYFWEVIAWSATPNPLGEWYCYAYEFDYMPDYPKFGVWNNEIVMTINNADLSVTTYPFMGAGIWAFKKQDLMTGSAKPGVIEFTTAVSSISLYDNPSSFLPADIDGPMAPLGSPNYLLYFKDDTWGYDYDHLSLWELNTDWAVPSNSTLEEVQVIPVEPFTTNIDYTWFIPQANTTQTIFAMPDRLMFRLQYRNFGDYEVLTTNHTVTLDENDHAGIRWYELRKDGDDWYLNQQSTYAPNEEYRWMGSISMDNRGNMALGYSVSSNEIYPSIRISGRFDTDEPGAMTLEEIEVKTGLGYQSGNGRWGDYSYMTIDPSDDQTFWYTQMYMGGTGSLEWETMISSVKIAKELTFNTDTLWFETFEECMGGIMLVMANYSWDSINVNQIQQDGYIQNAMWYIDNIPGAIPYDLPVGDSTELLVKVDFTTYQSWEGYAYDTMQITANGSYQYDIIVAINEELLTGIPEQTSVNYNINIHPNPTNGNINISFVLAESEVVDIRMFDEKMSELAIISADQKYRSGEHRISWKHKGQQLPAGLYYIHIKIGQETIVKKIVMVQ